MSDTAERLRSDIKLSHSHRPIVKADYYRENTLLWDRCKCALTEIDSLQRQVAEYEKALEKMGNAENGYYDAFEYVEFARTERERIKDLE